MMQMMQFQEERMYGAANAVGGMEACIEQTIEYCQQRTTFGQPLIDNQVIHFRMAELQTEVEAAARPVLSGLRTTYRGRPDGSDPTGLDG
jgi:citronellyl-CoA dehydrogenase